jgi:hypothetical protein
MWLGGDPDLFGAAEPLKGIASQIVTILTASEEEEPLGLVDCGPATLRRDRMPS